MAYQRMNSCLASCPIGVPVRPRSGLARRMAKAIILNGSGAARSARRQSKRDGATETHSKKSMMRELGEVDDMRTMSGMGGAGGRQGDEPGWATGGAGYAGGVAATKAKQKGKRK